MFFFSSDVKTKKLIRPVVKLLYQGRVLNRVQHPWQMLDCCKAPSSWKRTSLSGVICLMLPTSPVSNLQCWPIHRVLLDWAKWPNLSLLSLWLVTYTYIHQESSANHPHQDGSGSWTWEFLLTVTFLWNSLLLELYLTFSSKNVSG